MGYAMVNMSSDCVIKKDRAQGKGAATPFLAVLRGARIAICDELPEDAILDEEAVKRATGQSTIEARFLHSNPIFFEATHLPVLMTNYLPKINITDQAILRRLLVVPFEFIFKDPDEFDEENPLHRHIDRGLAEKLLTPESQQQLLTWLVRGARKWYAEGLPTPPAKMQIAWKRYVQDNDDLQRYLDQYCEIGEEFEVSTLHFIESFNKKMSLNWRPQKMTAEMKSKGFTACNSRRFPSRCMAFQGLRIAEQDVVKFQDE